MAGDIFTLDAENNAAVRTVSVNAGASETNSPVIFTTDADGNAAVRVVGSGGGDSHNQGYYATPEALREAVPTAEAGDWAIVGSTDTVWVWDVEGSDWVDTDQKGQVTSVNGQTGAVTLGINDVAPTQTDKSGYVLGTDGFVAGWVKPEIVQRSVLPQASEEEVGKIYQYVGTTDANYTNGYFYKCVSNGQTPATYSWENIEVQEADALPDQTGQSGKFLTTDGTDASWETINALENTATSPTRSLVINNTGTNNYTGVNVTALNAPTSVDISETSIIAINQSFDYFTKPGASSINLSAPATGAYAVAIGRGIATGQYSTVINATNATSSGDFAIAMGTNCTASALNSIQIGHAADVATGTNSDANTFKVANANGNFELMSADGTIPKERLTNVVTTPSTMPELTVAGWSNNTQTVTVTGVTATNTVFVSPAPASAADYAAAGIVCTAQAADSLTFTCTTVPTNAITVNVVIMG